VEEWKDKKITRLAERLQKEGTNVWWIFYDFSEKVKRK
jgi:hypothetical protein